MNSLDSKIREQIEKSINLIGYELMEIDCSPNKRGLKIVTFIDHTDGITMDDCVKATKVITPILELKEDDDYLLEVSSPGLNRKLITKEHFDRFMGETVKVKLKNKTDDRKNFKVTYGLEAKWVSTYIDDLNDPHKISPITGFDMRGINFNLTFGVLFGARRTIGDEGFSLLLENQ